MPTGDQLSRTVSVLPADQASIVYPTDLQAADRPDIVCKHIDGELVKLTTRDLRVAMFERRREADVGWWNTPSNYGKPPGQLLVTLCDSQAFTMRRNGTHIDLTEGQLLDPEDLFEIELLDRGALMVGHVDHLPLTLHHRDETFWRLTTVDADTDIDADAEPTLGVELAIERAPAANGPWEQQQQLPVDSTIADDVREFAEQVGLLTCPPSTEAINATLEELTLWWDDAEYDEITDSLADRSGFPLRTVPFASDIPDELTFSR